MIERKIQELKERIKNRNFPLTEDDKIILEMYPELSKELFVILSESMDYWKYKIEDIIIREETINIIPLEVSDNFWINYINHNLNDQNRYVFDDLEDVLAIINVKEQTKNYIRELVANSPISKEISYIDEEIITRLLDEKRYDLISKIDTALNRRNNLNEETIKRLVREFPYDQYETPRFFSSFSELLEDKLEKLSLTTLMYIIENQKNGYNSYENEYKIDEKKLIELFIKKLKETKLDELGFLPSIFTNIEFYIPYDIKGEIEEITVKNNILDLLSNYYYHHPEAKEYCSEKLIEYINKTNNKAHANSFTNIMRDNERVIDAYIENGFIETLINCNILENYPEKTATILSHIENNNPKYNINKTLSLGINPKNDLDIIEALIKKGITNEVSFSSFYNIGLDIIEFILNLLKSFPDLKVTGLYYHNKEGIEELIVECLKNKKYNQALDFISNSFNLDFFSNSLNSEKLENILSIDENILKDAINDSLYFSTELFKKSPVAIFDKKELLSLYFKEPILVRKIIEYINHHEEYEYMYNHDTFLLVKDSLATFINVNVERLMAFEEKFGPKIIRYIDNENIKNLLSLPEEDFEKFMNLFPNVEYKMSDLESAYDSLKQYEFSKKNPDIINIFPTIMHAIEDGNNEIIINSIKELYQSLDEQFFKNANEKYTFPEGYDQSNPELFVTFVIEKIKNSEGTKKEKYINILHDITKYYISIKREKYRDEYDMIGELKLPYTLDQKSSDREFLKKLIEESRYLTIHYTYNKDGTKTYENIRLSDYLVKKLIDYGLEEQFAQALVQYNVRTDGYNYGYSEELLKSNYKHLMRAINEISKDEPQHEIFSNIYKSSMIERLDNENRIKRNYNVGPIGLDIYEVITNLRTDVLFECILHNEEIYESLKSLMTKKKLHCLPSVLKNILSKEPINISDDLNNIAAFISYYGQIYAKEKSKLASNNRPIDNINLNLTNILINAEVYSGVSSIYSQILGEEDAKLIKANPGPNSASSKLANNGRLNEAIELTEKLYRRQSVTIPTFNECFEISDNKSLRVVAGNFTHPSNLTHGERTGACMRIGGVGETLFQFAINNPNGFHIRFEDPETGKYISRVTGFRNGNTVFLNELRHSCDYDNYSDDNIIEACTKAAEMLIKLSKNSSCPIDNVVVHRAYATTKMSKKNVRLNVKNVKEGLPHFYTDVNNNAIVLATTSQNADFVPVNTDKSNVPEYLPARETPIIYTNLAKASNKIIRIASIKRMLDGENYEFIEPLEFENGLTYAIVNDDWYIYIDEHGNIYKDCITIDPRAKEELAEYLIKLETELSVNPAQKEETYGTKQTI